MVLRSLFAPLVAATIAVTASAEAQPRYPFPPEIIAAPMAPDCTGEFSALKEEIGQRAQLLKAAADGHARPNETCRLISDFGRAELKRQAPVDLTGASWRSSVSPQGFSTPANPKDIWMTPQGLNIR